MDRADVRSCDSGSSALEPGSCIGPYRLVELLGVGGQAEVWRALPEQTPGSRHTSYDLVALKIARPGRRRQRLEREHERLKTLRGAPHVVQLLDADFRHSPPYLVLELLLGPTLHDLLHEGRPLEFLEIECVLRQLASTVRDAHAHGIYHRDLTPANVQLQHRNIEGAVGRIPLVKVVDYGIARVAHEPRLTDVDSELGTPGRIAPANRTDARADLWSLAVVCLEMLRGYPQKKGEDFALHGVERIAAQLDVEGRLRCGTATEPLPGPVRDVILRSFSEDERLWPRTVDELVAPFTAAADRIAPQRPTPRPAARGCQRSAFVGPAARWGGTPFETGTGLVRETENRAAPPMPLVSRRRLGPIVVGLTTTAALVLAGRTMGDFESTVSPTPVAATLPALAVEENERRAGPRPSEPAGVDVTVPDETVIAVPPPPVSQSTGTGVEPATPSRSLAVSTPGPVSSRSQPGAGGAAVTARTIADYEPDLRLVDEVERRWSEQSGPSGGGAK